MNRLSENATVHFSWWVKPYLFVAACSAALRGVEPDVDRVWARVGKGVLVEKK